MNNCGFMSMSKDLMSVCRYRRIQEVIKEHEREIKYLKSYLWSQTLIGRINTKLLIYSLQKEIKKLKQELNKIRARG